MRNKLDELAQTHEELESLMGATEIGVLFLDRQLRIQRFTAGMTNIFNIMPGDRGRPIRHLTHKMKYDRLTEDAEQVLRERNPVELEVQTETDNWFLLRMSPYRTSEDKVQGVVMSFVDINKLKEAQSQIMHTQETLEERVQARTRELDEANQNLSQARDLFENLFDTNPIPTSISDLEDGTFINVNAAYLKFYGLKFEDVVGHTSKELHLPIAPAMRAALIARVQKEGPIRDIEMETKLPSGESKTILTSLQTVELDGRKALMLAFIDITERVRTERDMRVAATSLNVAEQAERQRISQILHDDLQQNIFAVKVQLSFLADGLSKNDPEAVRADLKQLDLWLANAISTTRQLSIDLSPPILREEGFVESLLWLASQTKTQYGLDVTVEWNGIQVVLADDVRAIVLQSVRELLFNVVKHSGARQARIIIEHADIQSVEAHPSSVEAHPSSVEAHINIIVSDNGRGFDPKSLHHQISNGLKKMRDRLFLVGCNLKIESAPDQGSRITIQAPLSH
jgi:two-component system CheB/CheR fusion protein